MPSAPPRARRSRAPRLLRRRRSLLATRRHSTHRSALVERRPPRDAGCRGRWGWVSAVAWLGVQPVVRAPGPLVPRELDPPDPLDREDLLPVRLVLEHAGERFPRLRLAEEELDCVAQAAVGLPTRAAVDQRPELQA